MQKSAVIFDLDGVLADTARLHYRAWKQLANELHIAFDEQINERMKGVERERSLDIVLEASEQRYSNAQKLELAERKNRYYLCALRHLTKEDLLPGAEQALLAVRDAGMSIALASASKNAKVAIAYLGIDTWFDYVADANEIGRHKPHPEIFLNAASALCICPSRCIGVEDSMAGIESIKAAGMWAIGVGERNRLCAADVVIPTISSFCLADYVRLLR